MPRPPPTVALSLPARFLLDPFDTNAPTVSRVMDDPTEAPRRYISCSADNGRLYLSHVMTVDGGSRLSYWTREDVDKVLDPGKGDRRIHSVRTWTRHCDFLPTGPYAYFLRRRDWRRRRAAEATDGRKHASPSRLRVREEERRDIL